MHKRCADIEQTITTPTEDQRVEHRAYAISAVFSAAAFLESSINEVYVDAVDGVAATFADIPRAEAPTLLAALWRHIERRASILEKYQTALRLARASEIPAGESQYQNADALIKLRDALFHYKPQWNDDAKGGHSGLEQRLAGKFIPNPYALPSALWVPERCLGAGCTAFCVDAATTFSTLFTTTLGIPPRC